MEIRYIYHDGFVVLTETATLIFDFWKDPGAVYEDAVLSGAEVVRMAPAQCPVYVFVSHFHKDHFSREIFSWPLITGRSDIRFIVSKDVAKSARKYFQGDSVYNGPKVHEELVTVMKAGESWTDGIVRVRSFGSTDIGNSWLVEAGGRRFFHAGDLNAWIWKDESSETEVKAEIRKFEVILTDIACNVPEIDVAMFPVDPRLGTDFWTGAAMFVRAVNVRHFFPMHFELAENATGQRRFYLDVSDFRKYANMERGEYIALLSPRSTYLNNS